VSPVDGFRFEGKDYKVPLDVDDSTAKAGPLTQRIADTLQGIQNGKIPHKWSIVLDEYKD
jgi:branched-chain amino acid aminotransferase